MALVSQSEWARRQGFSRQYVNKLLKSGKIKLTNGKIDEYTANAELENQRHIDLPQHRKGGGTYFVQDDIHKLLIKTKLKNEIERGATLFSSGKYNELYVFFMESTTSVKIH